MASIRRQGRAYEIRECRSTPKGPRQFTLARFRDVLTPEVLAEAAGRAQCRFDADALLASARARGIPVAERRTHPAARRLLADLRRGRPLEPTLVAQLKAELARLPERSVPEHLVDAAEWIGRSEEARGRALRGLLRTAGRILHARGAPPREQEERFPRFSSVRAS